MRQRRVEIADIADGIGGEEPGRRVVEIGDRRLNLGEACFFAGAILGDLIDLPNGQCALAARARLCRHRLHRDAEPARHDSSLVALPRRRKPELLSQAAALLRGAGETENDLGQIRIAAEGAVGRGHGSVGIEAEQVAIGLVGIEDAARAVGDQRTLRQVVDEGLGDIVTAVALAEMENADGASEQAEHADHRKTGEDREHERLGHLARQHGKGHGRNGKREREHHHEAHASVAFGAVCGGLGVAHRCVDIRHGDQNSRFDSS